MKKEFIILLTCVLVVTFMTIHNSNLETMEGQDAKNNQHRLSQEKYLISEGKLIKLSNGVTIKRNSDLIIIEQSSKTIILNKNDSRELIAFLED
tara:strand:+ start:527 stop:808 length:282 start_codon:yes stop_codon:yes gene_type:complete